MPLPSDNPRIYYLIVKILIFVVIITYVWEGTRLCIAILIISSFVISLFHILSLYWFTRLYCFVTSLFPSFIVSLFVFDNSCMCICVTLLSICFIFLLYKQRIHTKSTISKYFSLKSFHPSRSCYKTKPVLLPFNLIT